MTMGDTLRVLPVESLRRYDSFSLSNLTFIVSGSSRAVSDTWQTWDGGERC
jgi:hypothetical protein